jgi:hypothetical protein
MMAWQVISVRGHGPSPLNTIHLPADLTTG